MHCSRMWVAIANGAEAYLRTVGNNDMYEGSSIISLYLSSIANDGRMGNGTWMYGQG